MTSHLDVLSDIADRLDKLGIDYILVGSLASMFYGRPRFTNDIDLVVQIKATQLKKFQTHFQIEDYYCPPIEILSDEVLRHGSFNLIHHESNIKIDINLKKPTDFYESEFLRRQKVKLSEKCEVYMASAEDIILKKLDFFREGGSEKHLNDIKEIMMETEVDRAYLDSWIEQMGLQKEWKKIDL